MSSGAETIQSTGAFLQAEPPRAAARRVETGPDAPVWRLVPVLVLLAAWGVPVLAALMQIGDPALVQDRTASGGFLESLTRRWIGPSALPLWGPVVAGLTALGVWLLARALAAPRWAAAALAGASVALPVLGLSPMPDLRPDDALFGAFMVLAIAAAARAAGEEHEVWLALAFAGAVAAALCRPWAAWPAGAVLLGVLAATRVFGAKPWHGFVCAMCWGPGLFLAAWFGNAGGLNGALFASPDTSGPLVREGVGHGLRGLDATGEQWVQLALALLGVLPLVALALMALAGMVVAAAGAPPVRRAALAAAVATLVCVPGAAGYGDVAAARLLLDPLLLGLAGAAALVAPLALRDLSARIRTGRARRA